MEDSTDEVAPGRFDASQGPRLVGPSDGKRIDLGPAGLMRVLAWSEETGGSFSLSEHLIPPRTLGAELHRHSREDEYSFVLEGRMGLQLGDEVVYSEAGDFVFKPREQWHTFWNAGDEPLRFVEIMSPGGFEHCLDEAAKMMSDPDLDPAALEELGTRYAVESDFESVPRLCAEHGVAFPAMDSP